MIICKSQMFLATGVSFTKPLNMLLERPELIIDNLFVFSEAARLIVEKLWPMDPFFVFDKKEKRRAPFSSLFRIYGLLSFQSLCSNRSWGDKSARRRSLIGDAALERFTASTISWLLNACVFLSRRSIESGTSLSSTAFSESTKT